MNERNGTVRIGALADLHYTRSPEPAVREVLAQAGRECDVLLLCGDLTDHGLPEEARGLAREIHADGQRAGDRGARQPRLRGAASRRRSSGCSATPASGCWTARRRRSRGWASRGSRGSAAASAARAGTLGGVDHQGVRARGGRRGAEARIGARPAARPAADRRAPLLADPGDGRGGAGGDLPLPRLQPAGGAALPLSASRRSSTATPIAASRRARRRRACRSTTSACRSCARLPRPPAVPDLRRRGARGGGRSPKA